MSVDKMFFFYQDESHYDDEKEIIQKQLKIEREELMTMCEQHQVIDN